MRSCYGAGGSVVRDSLLGRRVERLLSTASNLSRLLDHPVEHEVIVVTSAEKQVLEELAQVSNVWLLIELHGAAIVEVHLELLRHALCESLDGRLQFLVTDTLILLLLGLRWKTLPRQLAFVEVDEDETE